ncbi:MAG: hypothetical protein P4L46_10785 [Fimbriimonas sp.]|nr:hypothetical protein [Fimbriimonas sp.]
MKRALFAIGALALMVFAMGCSAMSGEVSVDQQKAKKDALQKVADQSGDPKPESRGR